MEKSLYIVTLVIFPPCILTLVKFNLHYTDILVEVCFCYHHGGGDLLHCHLDGAYSSYYHLGGVHLSYCLLDETISVTLPSWWKSASVINTVEVTFSIITLMELTLRTAILEEFTFHSVSLMKQSLSHCHLGGGLLDETISVICHLGGGLLLLSTLDRELPFSIITLGKFTYCPLHRVVGVRMGIHL
ncbi:Hypothetical predicted protein [Octopus vulgaris]|uniref:Uncharacterized protein n=1 Tax=Octopus vulgaris TaxID=6645 RepID=A0AA36FHV8_OCTVU|nr:Hypothetical predicted protein [Octopus vulgaris]